MVASLLAGTRATFAIAGPDAAAVDALHETWTPGFDQLGDSRKTKRLEALKVMEQEGDALLVPALTAFRSGLLLKREGRYAILGGSEETEDGGRRYPLLDPFTGDPLLGDGGDPVYVTSLNGTIKAKRAERKTLAALVSNLSLLHPDPASRRKAIIEAADRGDLDLLPNLKKQLSSANAAQFETPLRESIARIELKHGSEEEKRQAVTVLGDIGSVAAIGSLRDELTRVKDASAESKQAPDAAYLAAIEAAIASGESHQNLLSAARHTFFGLSTGSILVLLALGLSIIFGLMGVINMAHGEFMMVGAFAAYAVSGVFQEFVPVDFYDYYLWVAIPVSFLVAGGVGILVERTIIQRLYGRTIDSLLATWGIGLLLIQIVRVIYGDTTAMKPPSWLSGDWEIAYGLSLQKNRLFIIGMCGLCILLAYLVIYRTSFGLKLRATTQNRQMAESLGVSTRFVDAMTFGFGTGLAGVAGCAVVLFDKLNPNIGQTYIVDSFMVVVLGGVGNIVGTIIAGLGLGFLTKYLEPLYSMEFMEAILNPTGAAIYANVTVLILIVIFLQWRPQGLFPPRGRLADAV